MGFQNRHYSTLCGGVLEPLHSIYAARRGLLSLVAGAPSERERLYTASLIRDVL